MRAGPKHASTRSRLDPGRRPKAGHASRLPNTATHSVLHRPRLARASWLTCCGMSDKGRVRTSTAAEHRSTGHLMQGRLAPRDARRYREDDRDRSMLWQSRMLRSRSSSRYQSPAEGRHRESAADCIESPGSLRSALLLRCSVFAFDRFLCLCLPYANETD